MVKYQAYAEYKDSGVQWIGNIPKDWKFLRGKWKFKSLKEVNRDLQCMDRLALTMNGVIERSIDSDEGLQPAEFSGYQIFEKDDLVFKLIDLENFKTSRVGLVFKRGIMSPAYIRLKPFVGTDSKFFYYFYFDLYLRGVYNQIGGQGVRSALNATDLLEIEVCIPSLSEQKLIANFLDHETTKIDHLIEKQKQLIELLKEKRQAVISHAVTKGLNPNVPMKDSGVEWLGEVPEHWEIKQNKYLLEFVTSGSRGWAQYYADTGSLFFRIANLTRDTIEPKLESIQYVEPPKGSEGERSKIKINDLLISITADLGSVCVADASIKDGYVSQHVALCRPIKICVSRWLAYFILSDCAKEQFLGSGYGGTKIQLSLEDIKELIIAVPPRNEQLQISEYIDEKLTQYEHLICQAEKLIGTLQERRTALISAAVTGKIDVRNWQAPTVAEADTELSA